MTIGQILNKSWVRWLALLGIAAAVISMAWHLQDEPQGQTAVPPGRSTLPPSDKQISKTRVMNLPGPAPASATSSTAGNPIEKATAHDTSPERAAVLYEIIKNQGENPDPDLVLKFSKLALNCFIQGILGLAEKHGDAKSPTSKLSPLQWSTGWNNVPGCEGLPDEAIAANDTWLKLLAERGSPEAMLAYGSQTLWIQDPRLVSRDPARYAAFKADSERYLKTLVESGDIRALESSAALHMNSYWREPDPAVAWAYLMAAAWKSSNTRRIERTREQLIRMVPPEQRARAEELSLRILGGTYVQ